MCIQPNSPSKQPEICEATVPVTSCEALRGFFFAVWALLFDVLLQQGRQMGRVALQHGGCGGGQHRQPTDQFALHDSHWRQFGEAQHALCTQQRVVYTGSCWETSSAVVNQLMLTASITIFSINFICRKQNSLLSSHHSICFHAKEASLELNLKL